MAGHVLPGDSANMPDFYILGSKRQFEDGHWEDRLPDMLRQNLLEVGWGRDCRSFANLYGKPEAEIVSALKKRGQSPGSYNAHKRFLNLRPGDWVAIKKYGAPNRKTPVLVINAYARVIQRGGVVYRRGRAPLAHCINAQFVESGKEYKFRLGYGATIHRLSNPRHIRHIFAPVLNNHKIKLTSPSGKKHWQRRAVLLTGVENQVREVRAQKIQIRQLHHRLRNRLYKTLVKQHGGENVFLERDFVDITVQGPNGTVILYEIKPYKNVLRCVREALGQIALYAWLDSAAEGPQHLVVVGPSNPNKDEKEFIAFIKRAFRIPFDYLAFP